MSRLNVLRGMSCQADPVLAVAELVTAIQQPGAALVILFISPRHDPVVLEAALAGMFDCPVIGCTTAGEITSETGYRVDCLAGVSLASDDLHVHPRLISDLDRFGLIESEQLAGLLRMELKLAADFDPGQMFALLLVDGLSMLEEPVVAALHGSLKGIPMVGGSAGDNLAFRETRIYCNGRFHSHAAVLVLFETRLPFVTFQSRHFEPSDTRLVITESDCARRTVTEINGGPAAAEYARAIGLTVDQLGPGVFAANPLLLRVGGESYVRSIQRANPDGSLTFFCAIDTGLVLTIGRGTQLVENLAEEMAGLRRRLPGLRVVLGCDCILRRLELQRKGLVEAAGRALAGTEFVGFSTYGEQFNGLHVNQTLTGIALGE